MTERVYKLGGFGGEGVNSAIGIDPDSTGFVCALVKTSKAQVITKRFSVSQNGLSEFLRWVKAEGNPIVGIEGTHGQSRPIEKALRDTGVIFHSFKPSNHAYPVDAQAVIWAHQDASIPLHIILGTLARPLAC